jgi:prostaglandin-E synthase 1
MTTLLSDPQFRLYAICSVILSAQMLILGGYTAARRSGNKKYLNPEDNKVSFKDATIVEGAEHPEVARIQRAHRNLLESLPLFFALGLISVLAGANPVGIKAALITFTAARVLHSLVYIKELQPFRTMTYAIGSFALIGMMVMTLMAVLA